VWQRARGKPVTQYVRGAGGLRARGVSISGSATIAVSEPDAAAQLRALRARLDAHERADREKDERNKREGRSVGWRSLVYWVVGTVLVTAAGIVWWRP
jgi:hypothetical protein